jgi:hypothetical protein
MQATPDLSPLGRAALDYAARGWHVFPLLPDTKEPLISKRMGGRGYWDATTDQAKIRTWWTVTPNANIGLSLIHSGLVAVDADTYRPECQWASFIAGRDLPETLVQRSASGGTHYIFTAPKTADFPAHLCRFVDIKHKGYIVIEPSAYEGRAYVFQTDDEPAPAPDWLLSAKPPAPERPAAVGISGPRVADDRTRAYVETAIAQELDAVRNAPDGTRNNTLNAAAFNIGQIVGAGLADHDAMVSALTDAASEWPNPAKTANTIASGMAAGMATPRHFPMDDEPPFDPVEIKRIVDALQDAFDKRDNAAAEVILKDAMAAQMAATTRQTPRSIDKFLARGDGKRKPVQKIPPTTDEEFDAEFPMDPPPFPIRDFERDLTGLLRDLTIHIDAAARMRSEQGAFGAALSMLSVLFGRRLELHETGLRTNMYIVGTATSGAGKSSAMNAMKKAAFEFGISDRLGGSDFTSDAAILQELSGAAKPKLFCLDEFGDIMRRILGAKSASHEQGISRILKDVYSAAGGVYHGKSYAARDRVDITDPHMCMYGVSTYESFWQGINGASFKDGLIARFVVIPIGSTEVQRPAVKLFDEVSFAINEICNHKAQGNMDVDAISRVNVPDDLYLRYEREWATNQRHAERADLRDIPGAASIIMRISENAMKIAMISAAGRDHINPTMTDDDYDLGYAVAQWSAISMIAAIQKYYVESVAHRNVKQILAMVEAAGKDGLSRSEVTNRTEAMGRMAREEAIDTLIEGRKIVAMKISTKGPPKVIYMATRYIKNEGSQE